MRADEPKVIPLDPHGHRNIELKWRDDGNGPYCLAVMWDSYIGGGGKTEQEALRSLAVTLRKLAEEVEAEVPKHGFKLRLAPHLCPVCEGRGTFDAHFKPFACAACKGTGFKP